MTVVSNTSPLCYLVLIGHADILPKLYGHIHTTAKVMEELRHRGAPQFVRDWAEHPPGWLQIHPDPPATDESLAMLDPGERTALHLAGQLNADVIVLDESAARSLAVHRDIKVSGTLGVLCDGADAGFFKLPDALDLLRKTNFRASPELWRSLYKRQD